MKIGILTQPLQNNYGGLLQNYALQQVLIKAGHDVETIDQVDQKPKSRIRTFIGKYRRELIWLLFPRKRKLATTKEEIAVIRRETNRFINTYLHRTEIIGTEKGFAKIAKKNKYDAYIVGSDQCWRPKYNAFLEMMYLYFVKKDTGIVRISYAASFGTDQWEYSQEQTIKCASLLKLFDLVTVREDSAVYLCKEHFGLDAYHVLDPTLLLSSEDYQKLIETEQITKSEGSLFYYILDPIKEKRLLLDNIAKSQNLVPFTIMPRIQAQIRTVEDVKERLEDCVYPSVIEWISGFRDAKMVLVDSFHGAVFSIIFNKPFWVVANCKRGNARFYSLLKLFHLEDRMVSLDDKNEFITDWSKPIDWNNVNQILNIERKKSLKLLFMKLCVRA